MLIPYVFHLFLESELHLISSESQFHVFLSHFLKSFYFDVLHLPQPHLEAFWKKFAGTLTACAALLHYLRISIERIHLGLIRAKLNDVAVKLS